jgi:dolichyl-phosphate-mannose-protein mannosyltransferase
MKFIKKYAILILLVLAFATRFAFIWYPPNTVWDEQHFCNFTKGYLEGKYFFDIHPPLGKLILLGGLKIAGAKTDGLDCTIGNAYPAGYPYVASRIFPALVGSLLPALIYLLALELMLSPAAGFFAALFVLFDNAIFAESHFGLIDIFVPFFGLLAVICFLKHRKKLPFDKSWWLWLLCSALSAAAAIGVKWTGGSAMLVIGILTLIDAVEEKQLLAPIIKLASIALVCVAVYVALFAVHFKLLPSSGPGDAFMTERFKVSLIGTTEQKDGKLQPLSFLQKFAEVNSRMFGVNASQKLTHQDSSSFYEWPIGRKRIYFWVDKLDSMKRIFLLANPIVWLFGTITTLGSIMYFVFRRRALQEITRTGGIWRERIRSLQTLYLIYIANWLPFAAITRAMFLYHYFTALIASLLIGAFLVFDIVPALEAVPKASEATSSDESAKIANADFNPYVYWFLIALAAAAFFFFSPLSYGYHPFLK